MNQVRIGIVGCGNIARVAHIPLLRKIRGALVTGLADPDPTALAQARTIAPGARTYTRPDELLASAQTDAVIIALPTAMHANTATLAFNAGNHVYLEKPLAASVDEALPMLDAWRRSGKIGAIGHNLRFNPLYLRLKDHLHEDAIGDVRRIETEFHVPAPPAASWRTSGESGSGVLLDIATHHFDLLRFITGSEITSVSASIESRSSPGDLVRLEMLLTRGVPVTSTFAYDNGFLDRIIVEGKRATLKVDRARSWKVERAGAGTGPGAERGSFPRFAELQYLAQKLRAPLHEPSFEAALSAFVQAASNGTAFTPDLADGLATLRIVDAARRSAMARMPVAVGGGPTRQSERGGGILGNA